MSLFDRSKLVAVRNGSLLVAASAGVYGSFDFFRSFGRLDPFAAYKGLPTPAMDPTLAFVLKNVELKHYKGMNLTTKADITEVGIRRDRQFFDLKGINNGLYNSAKGPIRFSAAEGTWNAYRGLLTANQKVEIKAKDYAMVTKTATFDQKKKEVKIPGGLSGRILSGDIKADSATLKLAKNDLQSFIVVKPAYKGPVNAGLQENDTPRTWQLSGDKVTGDSNVLNYTNGEGTDGDIIVRGKMIQQDRKTDVITVTGKVEYYSGAANMTCEKAVIYRKEKRAVLTGNVVTLIKPKRNENDKPKVEEVPPLRVTVPDEVKVGRPPAALTDEERKKLEELRDPKKIREYPMIVRSDAVEYFYRRGQRRANISGNPQARQDLPEERWRQVWATTAFWDGEKELLTLYSSKDKIDVHIKQSIGDDLIAKVFTVSTKEEDETFTGENISGQVFNTSNDPDLQKDKKPAANPTTPPTTPPPGKDGDKPPVVPPVNNQGPTKEPEKPPTKTGGG